MAVIGATLLGPVFAVQIQKYLERWREENERRHRIFKVLMSTRAARLAANHVEALNLIDIEFPSTRKRFKKVRSAWKAYFTHLCEKPPDDKQIHPVFFAKRQELLTDMLYEMATALGYDFDKTQISRGGLCHNLSRESGSRSGNYTDEARRNSHWQSGLSHGRCGVSK